MSNDKPKPKDSVEKFGSDNARVKLPSGEHMVVTRRGAFKELPAASAGDPMMPDIFKLTLSNCDVRPEILVTNEKGDKQSRIPYERKWAELFTDEVHEVYVIATPMLNGLHIERVIVGPSW